jgi:hypothetical protein
MNLHSQQSKQFLDKPVISILLMNALRHEVSNFKAVTKVNAVQWRTTSGRLY